jgi:hypothetical protein
MPGEEQMLKEFVSQRRRRMPHWRRSRSAATDGRSCPAHQRRTRGADRQRSGTRPLRQRVRSRARRTPLSRDQVRTFGRSRHCRGPKHVPTGHKWCLLPPFGRSRHDGTHRRWRETGPLSA